MMKEFEWKEIKALTSYFLYIHLMLPIIVRDPTLKDQVWQKAGEI